MKQEEKTEHTRKRILEAAMEEFGSKGYAAASLNNICGAGISKGLLYHNFENKDAVYLACVGQCFEKLTACLQDQELGTDLQRYMEVRQRFFRENPQEARLFMETLLQPPAALRNEIEPLRAAFDAMNRSLFCRMLASVPLREGITPETAIGYFTLVQNLFNSYFSGAVNRGEAFSDIMSAHEKGMAQMLDIMLYGIAEGRA